jgi:hypothetical protein
MDDNLAKEAAQPGRRLAPQEIRVPIGKLISFSCMVRCSDQFSYRPLLTKKHEAAIRVKKISGKTGSASRSAEELTGT